MSKTKYRKRSSSLVTYVHSILIFKIDLIRILSKLHCIIVNDVECITLFFLFYVLATVLWLHTCGFLRSFYTATVSFPCDDVIMLFRPPCSQSYFGYIHTVFCVPFVLLRTAVYINREATFSPYILSINMSSTRSACLSLEQRDPLELVLFVV
jgi:hypothetical protein